MKLVPLNSIFEVEYGNQFDLIKMIPANEGVNFISRSSQNLGIVEIVEPVVGVNPYPSGLITVTLGGTYLLSSFVQPKPFYTAQNIKVLTPHKKMSFVEKLFYCASISKNRFRYSSHGREANVTLDGLLIPAEVPKSWKKIDPRNYEVDVRPVSNGGLSLNTGSWKYHNLKDLFNITGSKTTPLLELEELGVGNYPYVTTQSTNNSIGGHFNFYTEEGGVIACDSAVVGFCSYQPNNFSASDHVEKLIPKFAMNKYHAMFLVTILNLETYRYSYGRKRSQERIEGEKIKLPTTRKGEPDWDFMEKFIKTAKYSNAV